MNRRWFTCKECGLCFFGKKPVGAKGHECTKERRHGYRTNWGWTDKIALITNTALENRGQSNKPPLE